MAIEIKNGFEARLGLTVYYGLVWTLAVRRCIYVLWGRAAVNQLSHWHMVLYAALALSSWCLLGQFHKATDRIAALLYGVFYAIRIATYFVGGAESSVTAVVECVVISAGMIAMIVGLRRAISFT